MKRSMSPIMWAGLLAGLILGASSSAAQYKQRNLVSNQAGMAVHTDPLLISR